MQMATLFSRLTRTGPVVRALVTVLVCLIAAVTSSVAMPGRTAEGQEGPVANKAPPLPARNRVGAVFGADEQTRHYCTASVVDSPHRNLLITAAHCVPASPPGGGFAGLGFAPGFSAGKSPLGDWRVTAAVVDPRWTQGADPALDVAFLVVQPLDGRNIQDVVGGNPLGTGREPGDVSVLGYPSDAPDPVSCTGTAARDSDHQNRVDCPGLTSGTSGSPWLADGAGVLGNGTIVGVIGGRDSGGTTADTSYSSSFDDSIAGLYRQAILQ